MTFKISLVSWVTADTLKISETFVLQQFRLKIPSFTTSEAKAEIGKIPEVRGESGRQHHCFPKTETMISQAVVPTVSKITEALEEKKLH